MSKALGMLATSLLNQNDLIIVKTDWHTLDLILDAFSLIQRRHHVHWSKHRLKHIDHVTSSSRPLVWIPELSNDDEATAAGTESSSSSSSSTWFLENARRLVDKSKSCSLNLFVFNTLLSLDNLVASSLVGDRIADAKSVSPTYSLKSIATHVVDTPTTQSYSPSSTALTKTSLNLFSSTATTTKRKNRSQNSDQYEFKVRNGELFILDPTVYVENSDSGAYVRARTCTTTSSSTSGGGGGGEQQRFRKKTRPIYRIVSNQIEPFVIVSKLDDENLQNQTDCNDGLPCLQIESSEDLHFSGSFEALLNRQFMIDLIMSYRRRSNEELKNIKLVKARAKCCTG